jgi:hypothetical protein
MNAGCRWSRALLSSLGLHINKNYGFFFLGCPCFFRGPHEKEKEGRNDGCKRHKTIGTHFFFLRVLYWNFGNFGCNFFFM